MYRDKEASFVLELSSFDVFVLAQHSTQFEFYHISDILVSLFENKQNELNNNKFFIGKIINLTIIFA